MLHDASVAKKDAAVKCLEVMSSADDFNWKAVLDAGEWVICKDGMLAFSVV